MEALANVRGLAGGLLLVVLLGVESARAAEPPASVGPVLVGPVLLAPAGGVIPSAAYLVQFVEGARTARVRVGFQLAGTDQETVLAFAGRGLGAAQAFVDGAPVTLEPAGAPLPIGGGPFDRQLLLRLPPNPGVVRGITFEARCDTRSEERDPQLTYPQATFIMNRLLDGPLARVLRLDPGSAATGELTMRVETVAPLWAEAPVAGQRVATPTGEAVEGRVVADPAVPLEVAALDGEYAQPQNWAVAFGIGLALEWPHVRRSRTDSAGRVTELWYATPGFDDPTTRIWFRGLFEYAFSPHWMLAAGAEGDWGGALELPLTLTWFPQERAPGYWDVFADYRFFFGLAFQMFNDRSPCDYAFDPRLFLRVGGGVRLFLFTAEIAYEVAPPMGDWDGERGLLEHRLTITFPWAF